METAIAFAAGMLLTLIALALEDWTRLSKKQRNAILPHEEKFRAAKMFLTTGKRNPAASGQESRAATPPLEFDGRRPAA